MNQQPTIPSTPIDDATAEHLVDAYDAATSSNPEAKAAGMSCEETGTFYAERAGYSRFR